MQPEKNTQPGAQQPSKSTPEMAQKTGENTYLIMALFLVLLILAGGDYLLYKSNNIPKKLSPGTSKGLHNEVYSQLDEYKLSGSKPGSGASFSKPVQYKLVLESPQKDQASFSHSLKAPVYAPLGSAHILSVALPKAIDAKYMDSLNFAFSNPKEEGYKLVTDPIKQFVSTRFSPLYDISYSTAKPFTSSNIKSGAWIFDLTAKPKPVNSSSATNGDNSHPTDTSKIQPLPIGAVPPAMENYKGQVIFAVGKDTYYYFVIYNTSYNWDNNHKTWQRTADSLKIDR